MRAIEEYRTAIRGDPTFGRAMGRVAYAYAVYLQWQWDYPGVSADSLLALGLAAVRDGLARDSTVSDTWMALGYLRQIENPRTYTGVRAAYERAIALDRTNAEALHQYGSALAQLGQDSFAVEAMRQALAVEPQRSVTGLELGYIAYLNQRYAEALRWADSSLRMDPSFFFAYQNRAYIRLALGDTAGARRDATTAIQLGDVDWSHGLLAVIDAARYEFQPRSHRLVALDGEACRRAQGGRRHRPRRGPVRRGRHERRVQRARTVATARSVLVVRRAGHGAGGSLAPERSTGTADSGNATTVKE